MFPNSLAVTVMYNDEWSEQSIHRCSYFQGAHDSYWLELSSLTLQRNIITLPVSVSTHRKIRFKQKNTKSLTTIFAVVHKFSSAHIPKQLAPHRHSLMFTPWATPTITLSHRPPDFRPFAQSHNINFTRSIIISNATVARQRELSLVHASSAAQARTWDSFMLGPLPLWLWKMSRGDGAEVAAALWLPANSMFLGWRGAWNFILYNCLGPDWGFFSSPSFKWIALLVRWEGLHFFFYRHSFDSIIYSFNSSQSFITASFSLTYIPIIDLFERHACQYIFFGLRPHFCNSGLRSSRRRCWSLCLSL